MTAGSVDVSSGIGVNTFFATTPIACATAPSNPPPTSPPTNGTNLIKLIAPVAPALVTTRKPTALLMLAREAREICLIRRFVSFVPTLMPTSYRTVAADLPVRQMKANVFTCSSLTDSL